MPMGMEIAAHGQLFLHPAGGNYTTLGGVSHTTLRSCEKWSPYIDLTRDKKRAIKNPLTIGISKTSIVIIRPQFRCYMITVVKNISCKMNNRTYKIECPEDRKLLGIVVPTQKLKSNHVRAFQDGLTELVLDKELSGDDLRTLLGILANLEYENKFAMSLTDLSQKLEMPRSNLSKSVKKLVKKSYLTKEGNQGNINHYMVDPRIAFRSRVSKFNKVINRWDDLPQT